MLWCDIYMVSLITTPAEVLQHSGSRKDNRRNRHRRPPPRGFPGMPCFGPQICPSSRIFFKLAEALEQVTTEPVTKNKKKLWSRVFLGVGIVGRETTTGL